MSPGVLIALVVAGVLVAAVGLWLVRSSGDGALERPARVEQTDAHGRARVVDRYVYLALELCRVDGAIDETEIAAIEAGLQAEPIAVEAAEATQMVHKALRATIRQAQVGHAIEEIDRHADQVHRDWVVNALAAIAGADGTVNPDEERFLARIYKELGVRR